MPIGFSSMPSALWLDHLLAAAAGETLAAPGDLAGGRVIVAMVVCGIGGKGNALGFGHVVQHGS